MERTLSVPRKTAAAVLAAVAPVLMPAAPALAQQPFPMDDESGLGNVGWSGFTDISFLLGTLLTLTVAAVLGAVIAFHPRTRRATDTVSEAEAPKTTIIYAVIGAIIGLMVVRYGLIVGFVVFGIGGLTRFRTTLPTTSETGRLIFVTLIGLSAGLDLPHLAILGTAFVFGLIYLLESAVTYSLRIEDLDEKDLLTAGDAYRAVLEQQGCEILNETENMTKNRLEFVFRASYKLSREDLQKAFRSDVPDDLRGVENWEIS